MSRTVPESAWSIYLMMRPDATRERKEQLERYIQGSKETRPEQLLSSSLAYLMRLDLQKH
jgi:hypothetical protein